MSGTETAPVEQPKYVQTIDKGDIVIELVELGGEAKGFSFYTVQGKTTEGLVKHLDTVTKGDGSATVVMLANADLARRAKSRAKQMIVDEEEKSKLLESGKTLLISVEEALAYEPGTREPTSEGGLMKSIKENAKLAGEAKKAGDQVAYVFHATKAQNARKALQELLDSSMADLPDTTATVSAAA